MGPEAALVHELIPEPLPESELVVEPEPDPEPIMEPEPELIPEPVPEPEPIPEPVPVKPAPMPKRRFSVPRLIIKLIAFTIIFGLLNLFAIGFPKVSTNSMDPLISSGDRVAVSKMAKKFTKGDVIVFKDDNCKKLVARIVAVKGDVVSLNNVGGLYVNNDLQTEDYIHTVTVITDTAVNYPVIVEDDSYFVLGDNRNDSLDSRSPAIGFIDEREILGKAIILFFPGTDEGNVPRDYDRIGGLN
jgi:signal peptidase I